MNVLMILFIILIYVQVIIVCAYLLVGMSVGMSLGHTSGLLPQLNSVNSSVYVDEDTGSWIGKF